MASELQSWGLNLENLPPELALLTCAVPSLDKGHNFLFFKAYWCPALLQTASPFSCEGIISCILQTGKVMHREGEVLLQGYRVAETQTPVYPAPSPLLALLGSGARAPL